MDTTNDVAASPQAEDGHVDIANELAEAFYRLQLSENQWRLLWVIVRQTYGWHKKTDRISISYFERKTALKRRHVVRALNDMIERQIVTKNDTTFITSYGLQKNYLNWQLLPKKTVPKNDTGSLPKMTLKPLPKLVLTKEIKETQQKKLLSGKRTPDPRVKLFEDFWAESFLQLTGQPYVFSFAKDGKLIKDLLKVHPLEPLQDATKAFFKDERCQHRGLTIGIFYLEINRLLSMKSMNPLEQAKRELGRR